MQYSFIAASLFAAVLAAPQAAQYGGAPAYTSSAVSSSAVATSTPCPESSSSAVYSSSAVATSTPCPESSSAVYTSSPAASSTTPCPESSSAVYTTAPVSTSTPCPESSAPVTTSTPCPESSAAHYYPTSGAAGPSGYSPAGGNGYATGTGAVTKPTGTPYTGAASSVQAAGLFAGVGAVVALFL